MDAETWTIELLGRLCATRGEVSERPLSHKASTLLGFLALHPHTAHSREELATMLWPDTPAAAGRHRLRTSLYDLRRLLEPSAPGTVVASDGDAVRLAPGAFVTDVARFLDASAAASTATAGNTDHVDALRRAVACYGGELLPGFFEPWVLAERRRLADIHTDLLARLVHDLEASGRRAEAIDVAHTLVACDPLTEHAQLSLARLYAADGRIGPALETLRSYEALVERELGIPPSDAVVELARSLRRGVIRDRDAAGALPVPLTHFVGREEELERVRAHFDAGARLVTIAGAGGMGKTRFATELARGLRADFGVSLVYVELADVVDASFVAEAMSAAAGASTIEADPVDGAVAALAGRLQPLVVMDNAEHLVDAVAALVEQLLTRIPDLRVLVTSRRPLGVTGEVELRLGPLPTPSAWERVEDLEANPSVAMYVDRVRARRGDFALTEANAAAVARLCTRLEGIPLALELAAVRERVLPASQLVGRLERRFDVLVGAQRDVPERHRTLSAAIDWSYHALDPEARAALGELSVFRGGWTLEAAETICASANVDAMLERMCDVSLVEAYDRAGGRRFRMLETIREFALERVPDETRASVRRRHALRFLDLVERMRSILRGTDQTDALERLDAEFDNVRAALDASLRAGDVETVVRMAGALHRYWLARSRQREGRRWLRDAIAAGDDRMPRPLLRSALRRAGELALADGDLTEARAMLERAIAVGARDEDPETIGYVLGALGHLEAREGRFDAARSLFVEALTIAVAGRHEELRASVANDLGVLDARAGRFDDALERFGDSLAAYRRLGDPTSVVVLLYNLGYLATITGAFERAEAFLAESLEMSRRLGHVSSVAATTMFVGLLALKRGDHAAAVERCAEAAGLCLEIGDQQRMVMAIEGLGCGLAGAGRDALAATVLGHAAGLRATIEAESLFEDDAWVERVVAALRARLGEAELERMGARGRWAPTEDLLADVAPAEP